MIKVFSWISNTWKSYVIDKLDGIKYWEIARKHFDKLPDIKEFQKAILEDEKKRLFELLSYTGDENIIIDRTFVDNLIYLYYNIVIGKINYDFNFWELSDFIQKSVELYDEVILFTEPLKKDSRFKEYNDEKFNELLKSTIRTIYGNKVKEYKNSKEYLKKNKL